MQNWPLKHCPVAQFWTITQIWSSTKKFLVKRMWMVQFLGERYWCEASFYKFFQLPTYTLKGDVFYVFLPVVPQLLGMLRLYILCIQVFQGISVFTVNWNFHYSWVQEFDEKVLIIKWCVNRDFNHQPLIFFFFHYDFSLVDF